MKRIWFVVLVCLCVLPALGMGYLFGQKTKPTVTINPEVAWFRIDGSRLGQTAPKRLTMITLRYNEATIPCIVVDTQKEQLSNDLIGGAAISCGWTAEAIQELGTAAK